MLSFKGRNTLVLKRELGPIFRPIEAVVGAVLRSRGSDSVVRQHDFNFAAISASISRPKVLQSGHDHFQFRFKNRPRSLQFCFENRRNFTEVRGFDSMMEEPQSRLDRATIAVRSNRDRGVLP